MELDLEDTLLPCLFIYHAAICLMIEQHLRGFAGILASAENRLPLVKGTLSLLDGIADPVFLPKGYHSCTRYQHRWPFSNIWILLEITTSSSDGSEILN